MFIFLTIWGWSVAISIILTIIVIKTEINNSWTSVDKLFAFSISFAPVFNLFIIINATRDIIDYLKHKKQIKKEIDVQKQEEAFKVLDKVELKYIERYLRKKKLKKLK